MTHRWIFFKEIHILHSFSLKHKYPKITEKEAKYPSKTPKYDKFFNINEIKAEYRAMEIAPWCIVCDNIGVCGRPE